jgi:hypothetical protein
MKRSSVPILSAFRVPFPQAEQVQGYAQSPAEFLARSTLRIRFVAQICLCFLIDHNLGSWRARFILPARHGQTFDQPGRNALSVGDLLFYQDVKSRESEGGALPMRKNIDVWLCHAQRVVGIIK